MIKQLACIFIIFCMLIGPVLGYTKIVYADDDDDDDEISCLRPPEVGDEPAGGLTV